MIKMTSKGSWSKTFKFLKKATNTNPEKILQKYGEAGVQALLDATPKDTGLTSKSWSYNISHQNGRYTLTWTNSNKIKETPIVILLQYGHATRNGGWVEGIDFINPALRPIFESMANEAWKEIVD